MGEVVVKSQRKPKGSGHIRRSEILEAAKRIFIDHGYYGATVRKIAEQVGVSSTAIYVHFPDKRAMLNEIAAQVIGALLDESRDIASDPVDAATRVRRMMLAYMRFGQANPSVYSLVFCDAREEAAADDAAQRALGMEYAQCFAGVVAELAQQGRLREPNVALASQALWAGCHGAILLLIHHPTFVSTSADAFIEATIDVLLFGVMKI